jgi:hypothetical protein
MTNQNSLNAFFQNHKTDIIEAVITLCAVSAYTLLIYLFFLIPLTKTFLTTMAALLATGIYLENELREDLDYTSLFEIKNARSLMSIYIIFGIVMSVGLGIIGFLSSVVMYATAYIDEVLEARKNEEKNNRYKIIINSINDLYIKKIPTNILKDKFYEDYKDDYDGGIFRQGMLYMFPQNNPNEGNIKYNFLKSRPIAEKDNPGKILSIGDFTITINTDNAYFQMSPSCQNEVSLVIEPKIKNIGIGFVSVYINSKCWLLSYVTCDSIGKFTKLISNLSDKNEIRKVLNWFPNSVFDKLVWLKEKRCRQMLTTNLSKNEVLSIIASFTGELSTENTAQITRAMSASRLEDFYISKTEDFLNTKK